MDFSRTYPKRASELVCIRWIGYSLALAFCCLAGAAQNSPGPASSQIPTLFIVGDSTAQVSPDPSLGDKQRVGWGTPFSAYFDPAKIRVVNAAAAGRSSRTFITEGKWDAVVRQLHSGDFVLINFGHNDPGEIGTGKDRGSLPGIGEETREITRPDGAHETVHTFGWYLRTYVADTRAKGATPILISVTPRNIWSDGKVEMGLGHFRDWAAQIAREENVDYIDLTAIVARQYDKMGEQKVSGFFPLDHTHTDAAGAEFSARSVVAGLKSLPDAPLTSYLSAKGEAVVPAAEMSMAAPANPALSTLWIIGDSTVRNGQGDGANGQWGWGDEIAPYFKTQKINVVNRALGGTSSRTFYHFLWPDDLRMMHRGDFLLMQFGHNDSGPLDDQARARGTLPGDGPETRDIENLITHRHETVHTYGWYLRQMIDQARAKGVTVIVCSLIPRKIWDGNRIHRERYVEWAREAANDEHVFFINLNEIIAEKYEQIGQERADALFADPHTHTNFAGAQLNAKCVIAGLKGLKHDPLKKYLSEQAHSVQRFQQRSAHFGTSSDH